MEINDRAYCEWERLQIHLVAFKKMTQFHTSRILFEVMSHLKRVFQIHCGIFQHFGTFASSTLNAQSPWLNSYCPPLFLWLLRRAMLACFSYRLLFNRETFREFRYSHPVRRRTFIVIAIRFQLLDVVLLIFCCFCCCVTACVEYWKKNYKKKL